ncbi:DMT family transporter (plasmid) [Agrobacterium tumefaciens]|uniref:DMT family transporter n=1 Tax=Agrobacterium tumefaciens TaxID=358 RepID=UPI001571CA3A|nr:DMT family transporter [Agrobacterium tumefaciens]NSZ66546.1 DMT family transporter [Agrobacterium tumefaciens]NTA72918.1 DMT family transporter [Agrobacterium tumefaciens]WIE41466.1 DMT family transporter [Agrobacterium tumefaciens]
MKKSSQASTLALFAALAAVSIWGASPAATAVAGRSISPQLIGGLRTLLAGIILLPLLYRFRNRIPSDWPARVELVVGGVFGFFGYPLLLSIGVLKTSVTHASVVLASAPIFTGLLSFLITRRWPKPLWWGGGLVSLSGIVILITSRSPPAAGISATLSGDGLVLLSVIFASVGYVFGGRSSARMGQWPATTWSIAIGALAVAPFIISQAISFDWTVPSPFELSALVFLVLLVTIVGYALWFYALGEAGAVAVAPLQFLQPVAGVGIAVLLLGEALPLMVVISGALIIFGVWLTRQA